MAFPSITAAVSSMRAAGFQSVFIKTGSEKYQTLGFIKDGQLKFEPYAENTSIGQNKAYAFEFTASCKMLQASLTEMELVDSICNGTSSFIFKLSDAAAIPAHPDAATEGWIVVSAAQIGCAKAKIVNDGEPSNTRHIELSWQGSLLNSEMDAALKAVIDTDLFESSADSGTFHAIGTYTAAVNGGLGTPANIKPCGVSSITLADTGGATQSLSSYIKNFVMTYEWVADTDSLRRFFNYAINVNVEYDYMCTDAATLLVLNDMADADIDVVVTMLDGKAFTLTNKVGIATNFQSVGDYDKMRTLHFRHSGKVLTTDFDGIVA